LFLSSAVFTGAGNVREFVDSGPAVGAGVWVLSLGVAVWAPEEALGADSLGVADALGAGVLGAVWLGAGVGGAEASSPPPRPRVTTKSAMQASNPTIPISAGRGIEFTTHRPRKNGPSSPLPLVS
jgi:hypothetical protein